MCPLIFIFVLNKCLLNACMNERKGDKERRREAGRKKEGSSKYLPWQLAESRALRQLALVGKRVRGNSSEFGGPYSVPVLCAGCGRSIRVN